jgi:hypothetical protein
VNVLIVATGPSLLRADVDRWSVGRDVFAVNNAHEWCRRVDLLYACDEQWWDVHEVHTRHIAQRWTTTDEAARKYGLQHIPGAHAGTFDTSGQGIVYGGNSGFQALGLAYVKGYRDAVLLGFDMGQDPGGPSHCFGEHPSACDNDRPYAAWLEHWRAAAPVIAAAGMRVRNATRGGALECFERC